MQSLAQDFSACSLLRNVSWETFERLLAELPETRGVRLKYWRGDLEIVTPSDEHETQTEMLGRCAYVLIEALQLPVRSVGSTTFRRADLAAGSSPTRPITSTTLHWSAADPSTLVSIRRRIW